MITQIISNIICAWFAFLLPCYSTFKAISHRPLSDVDLEKWAMYWAVIGAFLAFEYTLGWLLCLFPFYWEIKTIFLLFLCLPQIQGSTHVYQAYLHSFFSEHEADVDAAISSTHGNILQFFQDRITSLVDMFWSLVNQAHVARQTSTSARQEGRTAPESSGWSLASLRGLLDEYGPAVFGGLSKASSSGPMAFESRPTRPGDADIPSGSGGVHDTNAKDKSL